MKHSLRDDLSTRQANFKWVLPALDSSPKAGWVQVLRELLDFLESRTDQRFSNVYTEDETWVYLDNPRMSTWIGAGGTRPTQARRTVASKKRMYWIDCSRTGIGAVVMLPAGQGLNKDFFAGTVLASTIDDRPQVVQSSNWVELFSILATHGLTSLLTRMTHLGSKDYLVLSIVRTWLSMSFRYSDILRIVLRDGSSTMTSHWKERCWKVSCRQNLTCLRVCLLNGGTGCSNPSIREAAIYKQGKLRGLSLTFRELALTRTDLVNVLSRAILVLCKAEIIPVVRRSFPPAGFRINPRDLFACLIVTSA
jgi:hypothetical protein